MLKTTLSSYTVPFSPDGNIKGYVRVSYSPQGIHHLEWTGVGVSTSVPEQHKPLLKALLDYQAGKAIEQWPLPVILSGSPFSQRVWQEVAKIPYGRTISYTELAARAGKPSAVRAAASACGRNPVPLLIPCHRVVAKDGGLGGFAWGLPLKRALLALESK